MVASLNWGHGKFWKLQAEVSLIKPSLCPTEIKVHHCVSKSTSKVIKMKVR